jgi:N6-adenosine-specific RNA methylase IME4
MSESSWKRRTKIGRALEAGSLTATILDQADPTEEKHRNLLNSTTQLNNLADIADKHGDAEAAEVAQCVLAEGGSTFGQHRAKKEEATLAAIRKQAEEIASNPQAFPDAKFRVIEADPPWAMDSQEKKSQHYQYPTQNLEEIKALKEEIDAVVEENAHLYLWATNPMLPEAFEVARAWGFKFKTLLTWHKSNGFGTGHYFRGQTEHVLFCVRGTLPTLAKDVSNHFSAPRRKHSQKPEMFYELIEKSSAGPYLRLYARESREGWTSWGNEIKEESA